MLGDMCSRGGCDERGCRRNIECTRTVATSAACVDHVRRALVFRSENRRGVAAHDAGKGPKLRETDRALVQGEKQAHDFRCFDAAGKQFFHQSFGFGGRQRFQALGFCDERNRSIHEVVTETWPLNLARDAPLK